MLSYVSRRRRWWKLLKSLDSSIELSEPMRVELLLELSGLSRQESLVIKACTSNSKSFEVVAATLVEHYSGVLLKEGRSLGGGTFQNRRHNNHGARNKSNPKGYGKGKTRGFTRRAYIAEDEAQVVYDDAYPQEDEDAEDYTTTLRTPPLGTKPPSMKHTPTLPGRRKTSRATRISSSMKKRPRPSTASRISIPRKQRVDM